jgi:hypothetical protein
MTTKEINAATRLSRAGVSLEEISSRFNSRHRPEDIGRRIARNRAVRRNRYAEIYSSAQWGKVIPRQGADQPPALSALADRDARVAIYPRDLTASICGDPLPGYSAGDRRQP